MSADAALPEREQAHAVSSLAPRREIVSWALFDFANSGYTTVVLTAVFNAYFVDVIARGVGGEGTGAATLLWTIAFGASQLLIVLSAPVLGAVADYSAAKKRLLLISTSGCVIATALLSLTGPGTVVPAMALIIVGSFLYGTGENLIAAFLPEISPQEHMGRISAFGWTIGYFGGLIALALCLGYVDWAKHQGLAESAYVPHTMLIVAALFGLGATPTFLWLKERATGRSLPEGKSYLEIGFSRLSQTLSNASRFKDLFRFLVTLIVYTCGTSTIVSLAAVYAEQVMGFTTSDTITMMIMVNVSAAAGAYVFGQIQDRLGSVRTLAIALGMWVASTFLACIATERLTFFLAANLMGVAMGSSQSGGRALVGQFSPPGRSAEFFGLWGLAGKSAAIIGPITYGLITYLNGGNHRQSILSTTCFFLISLALLATVNEKRGRQAALATID